MKDTHEDTGTPHGDVVRAPHGSGKEPPDVIEVVFPAEGPPGVTRSPRAGATPAPRPTRRAGRGAQEDPAGRPARPSHRSPSPAGTRTWPERPLLYGGVAIAGVGIAALLAWVVWPQSPAGPDAFRPLPTPSYSPLVLPHTATPAQKRPSTAAGTPGRTTGTPPGQHTATTPPTPVAAPPAGTARTTTTAAPSATAPRTLRSGDSGPDVTQLQQLLFDQGFTYVSLTGVYDAATERGVAQAQQDRGLTCDPRGVYGPCTRAALTS